LSKIRAGAARFSAQRRIFEARIPDVIFAVLDSLEFGPVAKRIQLHGGGGNFVSTKFSAVRQAPLKLRFAWVTGS
jgi:hypothetical protein